MDDAAARLRGVRGVVEGLAGTLAGAKAFELGVSAGRAHAAAERLERAIAELGDYRPARKRRRCRT